MLLQNDSIFNQLQSCDEQDELFESEADFGGLASRLAQGNATRLLPSEPNACISKAYTCVNPLYQGETVEKT